MRRSGLVDGEDLEVYDRLLRRAVVLGRGPVVDSVVLYENARLMRPLPMDLHDVMMLILAAVLPFVPLVFLVVPAKEVIEMLAKLIV